MSSCQCFRVRSAVVVGGWICAILIGAQALMAQEPADAAKAKKTPVPEKYQVLFETTRGNFTIEVNREWAPLGADRFHELVSSGFYDNTGFFRVVPGFVVQFGLAADPAVQKKWSDATIKDDAVAVSNERGLVTFAMKGKDTRTTQLFINYGNNARLDQMGFSPFGKVVEGMEVIDQINAEYEQQPRQDLITAQGTEYLKAKFPNMDMIKRATIVAPEASKPESPK